ncbi:uncharacterized protein V6R79_012082 [Siganus canaliculatus]
MTERGSLLVLLAAVVSSLVDLSLSAAPVTIRGSGEADIRSCPITYFGEEYTLLDLSFQGQATSVCFKKASADAAKDCVLVENKLDANKITVKIQPERTHPGSSLHKELKNIKSSSHCNVNLEVANPQKALVSPRLPRLPRLHRGTTLSRKLLCFFQMDISLFNFDNQAALEIHTKDPAYTAPNVKVTAKSDKTTTATKTFPKVQAKDGVYMDLSGCRHAGKALTAEAKSTDPATCSKVACDASAALTTTSICKATEACQGNNKCQEPPLVCTVTGSTVVDFFGRDLKVTDRCAYTLIKPLKNLDFDVVAVFRERRRQDVSFLDYVIISMKKANKKIYLEQGGEVRVDEDMLTVTSTAQTVHGVELTKDQTGVTAKITAAKATIFFDGNTAHVSGNDMEVKGLCGTSTDPKKTTSLTVMKSSAFSDASCANQHSDAPDNTINCTRATERCELLKKAPFTDCHSLVDQDAFITACTNVLCKYPTLDGLNCQFLEAYAKACSLKTVSLQKWRSKLGCSAIPQAFCQDKHCSEDEFCALQFTQKRCLCRAGFAAKYKKKNSLGGPTVCTEKSASLALVGCLLEERGIDYSTLHLNDPKCKGVMDLKTHMVTFSFEGDSCNTEVTTAKDQIIYKNTIQKTTSKATGVITRKDQFKVDFSCYYAEPDVKSLAFKIADSSVVQTVVAGSWTYTLRMNAYTNEDRTQIVGPSTEIQLNQRIWVELTAEGLDENTLDLVTDSCWATAESSPSAKPKYDLVIKECPNAADGTVKASGNGKGMSNYFSFEMFEFAGKQSSIFLHCKTDLCLKQKNTCAPTCSGKSRRRRSASFDESDDTMTVITMSWTK